MEKAAETLNQTEGLNHDLAFCVKRLVINPTPEDTI